MFLFFLESSFCSILHVLPCACATLKKKFLGALARRLPVQTAVVDFDKDLACLTEKEEKMLKIGLCVLGGDVLKKCAMKVQVAG